MSFQLKAILAETHGDLDEAERAAAEERVDVDEFADPVPVPVVERVPTPALSVSSDMETLQRKAKESGDMMTMLREQLPPPEPITERTTLRRLRQKCAAGAECQGLSPGPEGHQQGHEALLRVGFIRRRQ